MRVCDRCGEKNAQEVLVQGTLNVMWPVDLCPTCLIKLEVLITRQLNERGEFIPGLTERWKKAPR